MVEPKPAFPDGARAAPEGGTAPPEPAPAFPAGAAPRPPPSRPPATPPAPLFPDRAATRPALLDIADARLTDEPDTAVAAEARALALDLFRAGLGDLRALMGFGAAIQARVAAVPDRTLDLVRRKGGAEELGARMDRIRAQVEALPVEELFVPEAGVAARLLRRLAPPAERLDAVLRAVAVEADAIVADLPRLGERLHEANALVEEAARAAAALRAHRLAAEIVVAAHRQAGVAADAFGLGALQDRVEALRLSAVASATDVAQLTAVRETYARLARGAQGVVVDLLGLWKRQCVSAIALLRAERVPPAAVGRAATALREAGRSLAEGIAAMAAHPA